MVKVTDVALDVGLAAAAGLVGTKVMEPVSAKLYELESEASRQREDAARPGPPYEIAAKKSASVVGFTLNDEQTSKLGSVFHYGLAISWSPLYIALRRRGRLGPFLAGLGTGAAMSLLADELMTPALGFSAPNRDYPLATHIRGVLAHLAFGLGVAGAFETGWTVLGRRPRMHR